MQTMKQTGLEAALEAAQSQSRLAEICGVSQPTVWGWLNKGRGQLPGEYVLKCEAALGVSRHILRPDLYPLKDDAA